MDSLQRAIVQQVKDLLGAVRALVPYDQPSVLQDCYDYGKVRKVEYREDGVYIEAELVVEMRERLRRYEI